MMLSSEENLLEPAAACRAVTPRHELPLATEVARVGGCLGMPEKQRRTGGPCDGEGGMMPDAFLGHRALLASSAAPTTCPACV